LPSELPEQAVVDFLNKRAEMTTGLTFDRTGFFQ
jgi:hypothetical protein